MEANFRVGQYVLERPLGEGGMAEVWLARNVHIGNLAAVKFLNRAYAGASEVEQRFLNEGRRQGALIASSGTRSDECDTAGRLAGKGKAYGHIHD